MPPIIEPSRVAMAGKGLLERIDVVGLMRRGLPNGAQCHNHASHDSPHALRAQTHRTLRDDTGGERGVVGLWRYGSTRGFVLENHGAERNSPTPCGTLLGGAKRSAEPRPKSGPASDLDRGCDEYDSSIRMANSGRRSRAPAGSCRPSRNYDGRQKLTNASAPAKS